MGRKMAIWGMLATFLRNAVSLSKKEKIFYNPLQQRVSAIFAGLFLGNGRIMEIVLV
jgi:hypothetical protein